MGLQDSCISCSLNNLISKLESNSRLPFPLRFLGLTVCITSLKEVFTWRKKQKYFLCNYYYQTFGALSIFYFNYEHFLFVYIVKQTLKISRIYKNCRGFQNFQKKNFRGKFLKIRSSINPPWGHVTSHNKLGPIGSAVLTLNRQAKHV